MKSVRVPALIVLASLLPALPVAGAQSPERTGSAPASAARGSAPTAFLSQALPIHRVPKDEVTRRATATDLIGVEVADAAGTKIGKVADIDLRATLPTALRVALGMTEAAQADAGKGALVDLTRSDLDAPRTEDEAVLYIAVDGVKELGGDLLAVPASEATYDATEKKLHLAITKDGLADVPTEAAAAAARPAPAKQSFADDPSKMASSERSLENEVAQVQEALRKNSDTSAFAAKVTVYSNDNQIVVSGNVDTPEQKRGILDVARKATAKPVKDQLKVGSPVAPP